jgi:hypothetical protein
MYEKIKSLFHYIASLLCQLLKGVSTIILTIFSLFYTGDIVNSTNSTSLLDEVSSYWLFDPKIYTSELEDQVSLDTLLNLLNPSSTTLHLDIEVANEATTDEIENVSFWNTILVSNTHVWNLTFLFLIFYLILIYSLTLYYLPLLKSFMSTTAFKNETAYTHINSISLQKFLFFPIVVLLLITLTWVSPVVTAWFGHVTMASLQRSMTLLSLVSFALVVVMYSTNLIFNTKEIYDFTIVIYSASVWVFLLFYATNIFTTIFFIEILTSLVILLLITSTFSSSYSYDLGSAPQSLYFHSVMPKSMLNSLIFFFWMSLLASLLLFLFLIIFYTSVYTFEFTLVESSMEYILTTSPETFLKTLVSSFLFISIIFLKCGLVPLFVWKPVVFKGLTLHSIFFYIGYYYYFLLTFLVYILLVELHDVLEYNKFTISLVLVIGMFMLFTILIESYYLKSFLAMSSILNTLLIFIGLATVPTSTYFFNL